MPILFFEDNHVARFYPVALTRPLDDLRFGIVTIREKWLRALKEETFTRLLRPWLEGVFSNPVPDEDQKWIWINSRFVPGNHPADDVGRMKVGEGLTRHGIPVAVCLSGRDTRRLVDQQSHFSEAFWEDFEIRQTPADPVRYRHIDLDFSDITFSEISGGHLLDHAWELTHHNASEIERDAASVPPHFVSVQDFSPRFHCAEPERILTGKDVVIDVGAILDASDGPIVLEDGVHIMSGAMIRGPVAVGAHGHVRMGAKIYPGTSTGPWCKLGGETSSVIFQSYSNKAHDGYIGNSLVGEWVNIGADTNNSNLKNNYTTIKVYNWETGELEDSRLQFCGLFIADHCKTAINSMLNSGTVCGVSSSILTNNFPPKYIPSFGWVTDESIDVFELEKALETARTMMARRGRSMSPAYERMMRYLYSIRDGRRDS